MNTNQTDQRAFRDEPRTFHDEDGWSHYWARFDRLERIYAAQATDYVHNLAKVVTLRPEMRVLDVGCAYGHVGALIAPRVRDVALWDPSPAMQVHARRVNAGHANVRVLETMQDAGGECDLILMNSVLQYLNDSERLALLTACSGQLASSGSIVISDVIFDSTPLRDAVDVLRFAAGKGLLLHLIRGTVTDARLHRLHRRNPLRRIATGTLREEARSLGLKLSFMEENLTHFQGRYTVVMTVSGRVRAAASAGEAAAGKAATMEGAEFSEAADAGDR
jgi:2-polyprenyl-3-methyl-5-hydroxy-6-metoxy-1,4-benzoquinol methylase